VGKLPPSDLPYTDELLPKLQLRVGKNRRAYGTRPRVNGKYLNMVLGYVSETFSLSDAREACREVYRKLDAGLPVEDQQSAAHPRSDKAVTVSKLIDKYELYAKKRGGRIKSLEKNMKELRGYLTDKYLNVLAGELKAADIRLLRDKIATRAPVAANRFLAYLSVVLKYGVDEEIVETNFVRDIRKPTQEKARERVLSHDELAAIWKASHSFETPSAAVFGRLVRFLMLVPCRKGEAVAMRLGDLLNGTWHMKDNKSSRPTKLPLPAEALALLDKGEARALAFANADGAKLNSFSKWVNQLRKETNIHDFSLHDIRRSIATHLQDFGRDGEGNPIPGAETIEEEVIRSLLNHALPGISAVYMRAEFVAAKGRALRLWADEVQKIVHKTKKVG
jgi:integrase